MIILSNIKKTHTKDGVKKEVLKGIDIEINEGELFAITGKSGAGKTTLLNIIGGLDNPDSGEYLFDNINISQMGVSALNEFRKNHISFIFQNYLLLSDYTVYENVELPLKLRNVKNLSRKKIITDILEELDLLDIKNKRPKYISGGQKQRVAIARAICANTEVILADEPTASVDKENSDNIMNIFEKLKSSGKTIIIATHDNYIASNCDRCVTINNGVLENDV